MIGSHIGPDDYRGNERDGDGSDHHIVELDGAYYEVHYDPMTLQIYHVFIGDDQEPASAEERAVVINKFLEERNGKPQPVEERAEAREQREATVSRAVTAEVQRRDVGIAGGRGGDGRHETGRHRQAAAGALILLLLVLLPGCTGCAIHDQREFGDRVYREAYGEMLPPPHGPCQGGGFQATPEQKTRAHYFPPPGTVYEREDCKTAGH